MTFDAIPAHSAWLGELEIRRGLPRRQRRTVGPWCFLDRYGPVTFTEAKPMDVAPHPHIGLQTVTWLLDGEVFHRDSLGSECMIRPGELNLMTSGRGISHSEETPKGNSGVLNGVQLWVALPSGVMNTAPSFEHHEELPRTDWREGAAHVFIGELGGIRSRATIHSPMLGAEVFVSKNGKVNLPLDRTYEHALFLLSGTARENGNDLVPDVLYYLGTDRDELELTSADGARILLLGGEPFREPILMWWNFVARTAEEIEQARTEWEQEGDRFGVVRGYEGLRTPAPALKGRAVPPVAS